MAAPSINRRRFRFTVRALLAAMFVAALASGWLAHERNEMTERSALVAELARTGVVVDWNKPTLSGLVVRKFFPGAKEAWIRERVGDGWFEFPAGFTSWDLTDQQVAGVVQRLRQLGTVQEIHLTNTPLTDRGIAAIRSGLPDATITLYNTRLTPSTKRVLPAAGATAKTSGTMGPP